MLVHAETPEERELLRKLAELEIAENLLTERELELASLLTQLRTFDGRYARIVGVLLARLDELEAAAAAHRARQQPQDASAQARAHEARARAQESASTVETATTHHAVEQSDELRALYRRIARLVHPDLATDAESRSVRTRWMAQANRAYEAGDQAALEKLLRDWSERPESVPGESVGAQLVRTIRKIAQVRSRLDAIARELAALRKSSRYELMEQVATAEKDGRDLLAQMAARVAAQIEEAEENLSLLEHRGGDSRGQRAGPQ